MVITEPCVDFRNTCTFCDQSYSIRVVLCTCYDTYAALTTGVWNLKEDRLSSRQTDCILHLRGFVLPKDHVNAVYLSWEGIVSKDIFQTFLRRCVPMSEQMYRLYGEFMQHLNWRALLGRFEIYHIVLWIYYIVKSNYFLKAWSASFLTVTALYQW